MVVHYVSILLLLFEKLLVDRNYCQKQKLFRSQRAVLVHSLLGLRGVLFRFRFKYELRTRTEN